MRDIPSHLCTYSPFPFPSPLPPPHSSTSSPRPPSSQYLPGLDLNHEVDKAIAIEDDESEDEALLRNDDDSPEARLISKLDKLQLAPDERVFFGKSSAVM